MVRKGDGTGLGAEGYSQVRKGDGTVLWNAIPDTSMFQSPIYQWAAPAISASDGSTVDWPESLAGLAEAAAQNTPQYREDQDGFKAVEFTQADNDHYTWSPDAAIPTGSDAFSIAATVYVRQSGSTAISWGDSTTDNGNYFNIDGNGYLRHGFGGASGDDLVGSTVAQDQFITIGVAYDGGGAADSRELYYNGNPDVNDDPGSASVNDTNHTIGRRFSDDNDFGGFIHDIVVSDARESDQAFADYHNDRLGS